MFIGIKRIIEMNKLTKGATENFTDDGRVCINMTVRDDSDFLSPFCYDKEEILSPSVAEFLDSSVRPKHSKKEIQLNIYSKCIDNNEKVKYAEAIKNYYKNSYEKERQHNARSIGLSLIMLLAGTLFLAMLVVLNNINVNNIVLEIVDIFAWVFLWEAADIFFLERHATKYKQQRNISFYQAEINFLD